MIHVLPIPVLTPECIRTTRPIPCLMIPWLIASQSYQQARHWMLDVGTSLSARRNYLLHFSVEKYFRLSKRVRKVYRSHIWAGPAPGMVYGCVSLTGYWCLDTAPWPASINCNCGDITITHYVGNGYNRWICFSLISQRKCIVNKWIVYGTICTESLMHPLATFCDSNSGISSQLNFL